MIGIIGGVRRRYGSRPRTAIVLNLAGEFIGAALLPLLGVHAHAAASARQWRVGPARSATAQGWPVVPLYDQWDEYVGLVAMTPKRLAPVGDWGSADLQRLVLVQRSYGASCRAEAAREVAAS